MAKAKLALTKKALIDVERKKTVIWAAAAAFLLVFTVLTAWKLTGLIAYQNSVIGAKKDALAQLQANIVARDKLVSAYQVFNSGEQNVIGGSAGGAGIRDGSNAHIMIDALPNKYDFPNLTASVEQLALLSGVEIMSINGIDDNVVQSQQLGSARPEPVPMPFTMGVTGTYAQIEAFLKNMEVSIRPFQVLSFTLGAGADDKLTLDINAQTYYQPTTIFEVEEKVQS